MFQGSCNTETVVNEALDLQQRWPTLETEEKRRVVESIVESIVVDNDVKEIELTFSCIPTSERTTNSQQLLLVLLGICDRVIRATIPKASAYRRLWRGVSEAPKTLGEQLRRKRVDMGLTQPQ